MRSSALKAALALGLGALSLASSSTAHANGRYPAAGLIALDPSDPKHVLVRATYGLLSTADDGATWSWVCEQSVGFSDNEDPMVSVTKDGTIVAGVFKGLSASKDRACSFAFAGGALADKFAVDLSVEKTSPDHVLAIFSNGIGGGKFETRVFQSLDNATTWEQAGVDLPQDFLGLSVDAAPSDPQRIYTTGRFGAPDYPGAVMRSDDRGQSWTKLVIPSSNDQAPPYLSAIDPTDPDRAYVRLDAPDADILMVTDDGGMTWSTAFTGVGALLGFALSPDGTKIAIGGEKDGLWIAPKDTLAFTKVSELGVRCLTWSPDRLYACADEFKDGFHVGYSTNEGKTFTAYEHLSSICPLECPAGTTTADKCGDQWSLVSLTINATSCGAGGTGGAGGATSTGGGGGSETGGGGGCSCHVATGGSGGSAILFALTGLSLFGRRRRSRAPR